MLLLVHELGHAIAYKSFGLGVARIGFVPFLGAYAMSKTAPESAWVNALCALAGPFIGGLGCAALWWYGHQSGSDLMSAAATLGFLLNLFNMVPVVAVRRRRRSGRDPPVRLVRRHLRPDRG